MFKRNQKQKAAEIRLTEEDVVALMRVNPVKAFNFFPHLVIRHNPRWACAYAPEWTTTRYPELMLKYNPDWMAFMRPDVMSVISFSTLLEKNPSWCVRNEPEKIMVVNPQVLVGYSPQIVKQVSCTSIKANEHKSIFKKMYDFFARMYKDKDEKDLYLSDDELADMASNHQ